MGDPIFLSHIFLSIPTSYLVYHFSKKNVRQKNARSYFFVSHFSVYSTYLFVFAALVRVTMIGVSRCA